MIVITTPTGQIGHQVLEKVIDGGEPIRVIARDPSRLDPKIRTRVEVVEGSHDDIAVLTKAFAGADSVFWLVPPYPGAVNLDDYYLGFTRAGCEAITGQGVKQVVAISSLGRGVAENAGQISATLAADALMESTGVGYRALSMPTFMDNLLWQVQPIKSQGVFFLPLSGDRKLPTCATRDIAGAAAKLLLDHTWSGQDIVPVLGPEDLSYNDMAQIVSEVLNRPVRFQQVPGEAYKATLMQRGMTDAWAQGLVDMFTQMDRGIYDATPRTPEFTGPTSFRQWCEEVLKPAVLA